MSTAADGHDYYLIKTGGDDVHQWPIKPTGAILNLLQRTPGRDELVIPGLTEAPPKNGRTVNVLGIEEFLKLELPPRDHVLAPWLPTQGLAMIHAPRGVGKTHVALGIAYAIASGGEFLRWSAPQPRGVLFIDGEMPARTLQERLAHIIAANDREPSAPLRLITPDMQPLGMPDLSDPDDQVIVDAQVEGVELIIADNISTLCRRGKENEAESWLAAQGWALAHRSRGRSVLFIHHSGKGGAQRGTSRREDILDTVIGLRRPPEYAAEQGAVFELSFEKARGFYGEDAQPFEATLTTDQHGTQQWVMRSVEDSTYERIVGMHRDGLTPKDIGIELGLHKSRISRHLKRARSEGRIL